MPTDMGFIIVAALAPTIASLGAILIGVRNGAKSDEIHVLVNSRMDALRSELLMAKASVENLKQEIFDLKASKLILENVNHA